MVEIGVKSNFPDVCATTIKADIFERGQMFSSAIVR